MYFLLHRVLEIGSDTQLEATDLADDLPVITQLRGLEILSLFNYFLDKDQNISLMRNLKNLKVVNVWQCHPKIEEVIHSRLPHINIQYSPDSVLSSVGNE